MPPGLPVCHLTVYYQVSVIHTRCEYIGPGQWRRGGPSSHAGMNILHYAVAESTTLWLETCPIGALHSVQALFWDTTTALKCL